MHGDSHAIRFAINGVVLELDITGPDNVPLQADGELCGLTPAKFRRAPFPLQVIA